MEIDEHPESVWCAHGLEWPWDRDEQLYKSPHDGVLDVDAVNAGALPDECQPARASKEGWLDAKKRGVVR